MTVYAVGEGVSLVVHDEQRVSLLAVCPTIVCWSDKTWSLSENTSAKLEGRFIVRPLRYGLEVIPTDYPLRVTAGGRTAVILRGSYRVRESRTRFESV